jgi:hypothetical protein
MNLNGASGRRPSRVIESQSVFYFAASGALKGVMLITGNHHRFVGGYTQQMHVSAAHHAPHRLYPPLQHPTIERRDNGLKPGEK